MIDICAVVMYGVDPLVTAEHSEGRDDKGSLEVLSNCMGQYQRAVLVDVYELVQKPEGMGTERLPSVVRLQRLNACDSRRRNTLQPSPLNLLLERNSSVTDREPVLGDTLTRGIGLHKLPNQVVENGPEVMQAVSKRH